MNIQKINWKIFLKNPEAANPDDFFRVFNGWIPNSPEVFVDVADYKHIQDGPLTLLAGHYVDYYLDHTDRRLGFLYSQKRLMDGGNEEKITSTLKTFLKACQRLVEDPLFKGKLKLKGNELLFIINDRAIAPNNAETFNEIKSDLEKVASKVFGSVFSLEQISDPKKRFSVIVTSKEAPDLKTLVERIS